MSSKINLQTCEYACKSSVFQDNQLIYFKPEYNVNFVENFPNENHKGYKQYFELDYNSLCVEIDLEFDSLNWVQLYSDANKITTPI